MWKICCSILIKQQLLRKIKFKVFSPKQKPLQRPLTAPPTQRIATLKADSAIRHTQSALADISLGLEKIDAIARKVQEDSLAKNLLETKDLIEKVSQLSQKLTAVIQGIKPKDIAIYDEKSNRSKPITWKNMHIWGGKARDKHK